MLTYLVANELLHFVSKNLRFQFYRTRVTLCNAACQVKLQAGHCPGTMFLTMQVVENKSDTHHTQNIEMALEYVVCENVLHNSNSILE